MSTTRHTARPVLFHGPGFMNGGLADALDQESVEEREVVGPIEEMEAADRPAVLVLDGALAAKDLDGLRGMPDHVTVVAIGEDAERAVDACERLALLLPEDASRERTLRTLQMALRHSAARVAADRADRELERTRAELKQLNRIGMALMTEREPDVLLVEILDRACEMTGSDAGSLYLVEKAGGGEAEAEGGGEGDGASAEGVARGELRFKLTRNDSLPDLGFEEFTLPINRSSLSGYVAATGEPLVLDDAYEIPASAPYSHNPGFDRKVGYRTKSMLVVPMADHRGKMVGVLQLINRKRDPAARITDEASAADYVLPYTEHELELVQGLAGQAAVSIENSQLYQQIQDIFESFVKAAVAAIDQRDPTTAGHSVRVATLTTDLAETLRRYDKGRWAGVDFTREQMREIRYAALLHDFGKVGVREEVLVKSKKLPPTLWERVESRFHLIRRTFQAQMLGKKSELLSRYGPGGAQRLLDELEEGYAARLAELERFREAVHSANEPRVLPEESEAILEAIAKRTFTGIDGEPVPFITPEEFHFLSIPKGSLDERERKEIESHVQQTYEFLRQIPWTEDLKDVADIAYGHHEKLDGRGYPRGVTGEEIPVQTRIMTIADIFDALTASDRPYKRALPAERALDIISMEAKEGMLDSDLVDLLLESEAYRKVLEKDWREL